MHTCLTWFVITMFTLTGCAPTRTSLRSGDHNRYGTKAYQKTLDGHGRPVFQPLPDRPKVKGEKFSLVEYEGGLPVVSYEIEIKDEPNRDFLKPVKNLFANIVLTPVFGIVLGCILVGMENEEDEDAPEYEEAFALGLVIGTGAGLVYTGYSLGEDTSRLVINKKETVVSETYYSYDEMGRLESFLEIPPPGIQWDSKTTRFFYDGDGTIPSNTETIENSGPQGLNSTH